MRWLTALVALASFVIAPAPPTSADDAHFIDRTVGSAGPLGSVTFIGDSVGIGAGRFAPTLPDHLLAQGWGPVRFHAVDGKRTGYPPGWPDYFNAVPMIDDWQAGGWDSDTWIINLGANDSGYCGDDVACARAAIMLVVDAIGPGHRIWWPKITRFYTLSDQAAAWNTALDQIDAERDDVWTWDWPAEMQAHPDVYGSWDNTHLYPDGYRYRSAVLAGAFTDAVAAARRVGPDVAVPAPTGGATAVMAIPPSRLLDTRLTPAGRLAAGATTTIDLSDRVPARAVAVAVNLTMVDPAAPGYLVARACDAIAPPVSSVNTVGRTRAAGTIVLLSASRTVCADTSVATDIVVDLQAVFVPVGTAGSSVLRAVSPPVRLVDTRITGRAEILRLRAPDGARVAAINITVTGADAPGYVTAFACGTSPPTVSNVNAWPGETSAGAGFVQVGQDNSLCVFTSTPADVIVDLTATLQPGEGLAYVPVTPTRMVDTRSAVGGWSPIHGAGQTIDVGVAPPGAGAVSGTITIVHPVGPSFVSAAPCGSPMSTSSVNAGAREVVANGLTVGVGAGRVCLAARTAGHTLFDVSGWWVPT